jgi:hypothetical protein
MALPSYNTQESATTGGISGFTAFGPSQGISFGAGLAALGRGVADAGAGVANYAVAIDRANRQQKEQQSVKEVNEKYSQLRLDWAKRQNEYDVNPQENQLELSVKEYDDYVGKMIEGASSPEVAQALKERADSYKVGLAERNHKLQFETRAMNFALGFDQMLTNAGDAIFTTKSQDELFAQQELLNTYIDEAVSTGRIQSKQTVEALRSRVKQLPVSWADTVMGQDPESVIAAVETDMFAGVKPETRQTIKEQAERVLKTRKEVDKQAIVQSFESDRAQLMITGVGSAFSYDAAKEAFGETKANQMKRELDSAASLYRVSNKLNAADGDTIRTIMEEAQPKSNPNSTTYAEESEYFQNVRKLAIEAQKEKEQDAFSFFAKDPMIASVLQEAAKNPDDLQAQRNVRELILARQKADNSLQPWQYSVMPSSEAKEFVTQFNTLLAVGNKEDGMGVRERLLQFNEQFKDHVDIALSQLNRVPGGDKVTPKINPLMWHLNNPSTFRLIVDAVRKDDQEVMKRFDKAQKESFFDEISTDPNLVNYTESVLATNNSPEAQAQVQGVMESYRAFARDWKLNGGKLKDASSAFFNTFYTFGESNGITYSRPREYKDDAGKAHIMSDEQAKLSNEWLNIEIRDIVMRQRQGSPKVDLDYSTVVPESRFFTPEQLKEDVADALETNSFWAASQAEDGVYLYVKGNLPGTSVMVKDKSGKPIFVPFNKTVTGRNRIGKDLLTGQMKVIDSRTDDSFWDRFGQALNALND